MAIRTRVAKHYSIRLVIFGVLCVVLAVWGAYDLWVKIPRREAIADRFETLMAERTDLAARSEQGENVDAEAARLESELATIAPGGATPERPGKFDRLTQWFFISALPAAPYFFWLLFVARRGGYALDDDGTLTTPGGTWTRDDIKDIDMSKWMAKSTAQVVHRDGHRVKLDDYIQADANLIVGALASRFHPEEWDAEAKPVKATDESIESADKQTETVESSSPSSD